MKFLQERWDWFVFHAMFKTAKRMYERGDGGFVYLLECHLCDLRKVNPISESLKESAESFHGSLKEYSEL
jgi:hypothetical protein